MGALGNILAKIGVIVLISGTFLMRTVKAVKGYKRLIGD